MYLIIFILIFYSILDWHVVKCVKTFCISIYLLVSSIEKYLTDEFFKESLKKDSVKGKFSTFTATIRKKGFFTLTFCVNACSKKARKSEGKTVY